MGVTIRCFERKHTTTFMAEVMQAAVHVDWHQHGFGEFIVILNTLGNRLIRCYNNGNGFRLRMTKRGTYRYFDTIT